MCESLFKDAYGHWGWGTTRSGKIFFLRRKKNAQVSPLFFSMFSSRVLMSQLRISRQSTTWWGLSQSSLSQSSHVQTQRLRLSFLPRWLKTFPAVFRFCWCTSWTATTAWATCVSLSLSGSPCSHSWPPHLARRAATTVSISNSAAVLLLVLRPLNISFHLFSTHQKYQWCRDETKPNGFVQEFHSFQ